MCYMREEKQELSVTTASRFPKCRATAETAPAGEWICEVCSRDFKTKIGLGQHKRLAHLIVRNQERIVVSHPNETSARGAHKRC